MASDTQPVQTPEISAHSEERAAHSDRQWVWQVTALSLILGIMLALALRTTAHIRRAGLPDRISGDLQKLQDRNADLETTRDTLREEIGTARLTASDGEKAATNLREQLQQYRAMAGYAAVQGPGLVITLRDSPIRLPGTEELARAYLLEPAVDLRGVVNELWAAGAEALAVAGADRKYERFVVSTSVQALDRSALVNGRHLAPPFYIRVIGNPKELKAALEMPEGIVKIRGLDELRMIVLKETKQLELPAFANARVADTPRPREHAAAADQ
jgi:uncharacterized protein YlxW (UPF0749 family)